MDRVYVSYGHTKKLPSGTRSSDLCGWNGNTKEAEFRFSLKINDIEMKDYDNMEVEKLMDEIQKTVNRYMKTL